MTGKHLLEGGAIHRPRIGECGVDLVSERLLEAASGELLAPQFPFSLRLLGIRQDTQPLVAHQLVVQLTQAVPPRRVPLESLAREVVVVHDQDVCVPMAPSRVRVDDHQVVG